MIYSLTRYPQMLFTIKNLPLILRKFLFGKLFDLCLAGIKHKIFINGHIVSKHNKATTPSSDAVVKRGIIVVLFFVLLGGINRTKFTLVSWTSSKHHSHLC